MMPKRVLVIGLLFCLAGVLAIGEFFYGLFNDHLKINFAAALLPIGLGLLRGSPTANQWARATFALSYVFCAFLAILIIVSPDNLTIDWFGFVKTGEAALPYAIGFTFLVALSMGLMHRLLRSRKATAYCAAS